MTRAALLAFMLFACGGGGSSSTAAKPVEPTEETAKPTEEAKPIEEAKPVEEAKPPPPDEKAIAAAALTAQLDAGKKVFEEKGCVKCHGAEGKGDKKVPALIGDKALPEAAPKTAKVRKGVKFQTAKDVQDFIKAKMPLKAPGTLSDDEAAAVTAWILNERKVTLDKKLDAASAGEIKLR